jgi:small subunit ribosomal protein S16
VAVVIRMKKMGRAHRHFFRICATDKRAPRDGRVLEELGTYDPMVPETDARARLKNERIDYWIGVGALPSEKVADAGTPAEKPQPVEEAAAEAPAEEATAEAAAE